ncbi:tumor necrosis factor receptor superfamily member 25 [Salarias fasciatus]|uniref:Tumor necrosis factor receptor superfamily member 25-like n=1 Tax=Salarias fasciatus TaxID=181472 RepID=A0A672IHY0_SALFA|nr:tumor necrosis factor receptor superfamily member 25-like [Salarias fasciatus]
MSLNVPLIQSWLPNIMDYMLVFHLMFGIISGGHIHTVMPERTNDSQKCYATCPAGYYKRGLCGGSAGNYSCERCGEGTYTAIENSEEQCHRCSSCNSFEVQAEECVSDRDTKCVCKDGYYKNSSEAKECYPCKNVSTDGREKWEIFQKECLVHSDCKRKCEGSFTSPNTTATTILTAVSPTSSQEKDNLVVWLLAVVAAVLVVVVWLLLLFTKNMLRKDGCCLCWTAQKNLAVEDPKCKEQLSHQDSSLTTLTIKVCEETPMMPLNQSPTHPALTSRPLPDTDHTVSRPEELSDRWPAIVLYTIIKAVPLRRWKEFLRLLSVADQDMERVELEAGPGQGFTERQYQMLRLWSQRSSASMGEVFSTLHYMNLSGCAQLLQESLEKLPRRCETKQDSLTCEGPTDCGSNGAMQGKNGINIESLK